MDAIRWETKSVKEEVKELRGHLWVLSPIRILKSLEPLGGSVS